jgi:hemerythrin-like domain-containing protein
MSTLNDFRDRQGEILGMLDELKVMLTPENLAIKPNAKAAHEHLCSLADKVKQHLAAEDRGVYPALLIHEDPKLKSLAWGFISGEKPLRKQFDSFHRKWLKNCDFEFSDEFLVEAKELFRVIEERLEREQNVLLPRLEETGIFGGAAVQAV